MIADTEQDDTASTTEEEAEEAPPPTPRPVSRSAFLTAVALAGFFLLLAVVMSIVAASVQDERDQADDEREAVARSAGETVAALFSYDHSDPEASRERVARLAGQPIVDQYDEQFTPLLEALSDIDFVSRATVKDVYVSEIDDGQAAAIVVADLEVTSTAGLRQLDNAYTRVGLAETEGRWVVVEVQAIDFAQVRDDLTGGGVVPGTPSESTTTTAG
jgi:Mce-associated membrane protein